MPKACFAGNLFSSVSHDSGTNQAKLISFDKKGRGEEGVFAEGSKKGTSKSPFNYRINENELLLLDKKSGIMTRQFIIDELSESTLRIHDGKKDCETWTFSRIK